MDLAAPLRDRGPLVPVILSGGSGTRLWPLSRRRYPKQFLPLDGKESMLQATVRRLEGLQGASAPIIVCNTSHRFLVAEQLLEAGIEPAAILLEPSGRNTAPAIAVAALTALEMAPPDQEPVLLVMPADHVIRDVDMFERAVVPAWTTAEEGRLVTFGVVPKAPETGFGYIKRGAAAPLDARDGFGGDVFEVVEFVEKPDPETAQGYVAAGDYLWNSGMFMFQATRYLDALTAWAPEIRSCCEVAVREAREDLDFVRLDAAAFERCPCDSIDYAVMEHVDDAIVIPLDVGWSDVGSWGTLHEVGRQDASGNVVVGDVLAEATTGSYLRAEQRLLVTLGVSDCVIVETTDAVLVADRNRAEDVKRMVEVLGSVGRSEVDSHARVHRPWGWYETITVSDRFLVKHLHLRPGATISLQRHHHRAEHWVVVRGTARVTADDNSFLLGEDQSTYIPLGTEHRLENEGVIPLEIIEIQTGSYLGEDDIVRLADTYGRGITARS